MARKVAVIDGNSLMHRAYHAVPPTMNAPDGTPTNAVFGFLSMILKFIDMAKPDVLVCAFDAGKPAFRMEALAQYKAQRPPMDDELRVQFPIIEELLSAMDVPVVKVPGWEGDDILGTVAARDEALGYETLLVTGDKDAYQLATENTHIVTTKRGITDVAIYGPAEVLERYGVSPEQFPDFLGLMGDSSDNIPGVPGIGAKTAAKLLQDFGSMEGIYEHLQDLKGKQLQNLQDNKEMAYLSRDIATIMRDLDFSLDVEALSFPDFDAQTVQGAFEKYRLNSHLTRVLKLIGAKHEPKAAPLTWEPLCKGAQAIELVKNALDGGEAIGIAFIDPEQISLFDQDVTAAFSTSAGVALFKGDTALDQLTQVVSQGKFAALDIKRLLQRIYPNDTSLPSSLSDQEVLACQGFDLSLAGYVLDSSQSGYTLASLMEAYGGGALPESEREEECAAIYASACRHLQEPLIRALKEDGSYDIYEKIDRPLIGVLALMERTGAALDCDRLGELGQTTEYELDSPHPF